MSYPFVQSPYFQSRNGNKVLAIVIHTMVGTYDGTIQYFKNNDRQVSAHYCVSLEGAVTQMVDLAVGANHAGNVSKPTAKVVLAHPGVNPNWYTVGIENADNSNPAGADRTNQMPGLAKLVAELCTQFKLPANRDTIIGHREVYAVKSCPGNINLDELVQRVQALLGGNMATINIDVPTWERVRNNSESYDAVTDSLGLPRNANKADVLKRIDEVKQSAYSNGVADGKRSVPNQPAPSNSIDLTKYEENGLTVEFTDGNKKTITNYKRK
jgi:N-acetylmuramoyl-L-alanine amidase